MRQGLTLVTICVILAAALPPTGVALGDIFGDPDCEEGVGCSPATLCVEGYYCQADACDPATRCDARSWLEDECAYNETHQGQTCALRARATFEIGGRRTPVPGIYLVPGLPVPGSSVRVPHSEAGVGADWSRGFFYGEGVTNEWVSGVASVRLQVLDVDLGQTSAAVYQSTINTPENATDPEHLFVWGVGTIHHDGPLSSAGASVGGLLMDGQPEECFLRLGPRSTIEVTCEDLETLI